VTPILRGFTDWVCPSCKRTDRTTETRAHTRFHPGPKMHGLTTPMVRAGTAAKLVRNDRDDYVGRELVPTDDRGRPVMSITTVRDDGQDAVVFAPTATATGDM
jgi:hypothetical protein